MVEIDGQPWFVAADVCRALELGWDRTNQLYAPSRVMKNISPDERTSKKVARGAPPQIVIAESGLYKLVLRSKVEGAKDFQNWVTRVVLPAIRKDGGYTTARSMWSPGR